MKEISTSLNTPMDKTFINTTKREIVAWSNHVKNANFLATDDVRN